MTVSGCHMSPTSAESVVVRILARKEICRDIPIHHKTAILTLSGNPYICIYKVWLTSAIFIIVMCHVSTVLRDAVTETIDITRLTSCANIYDFYNARLYWFAVKTAMRTQSIKQGRWCFYMLYSASESTIVHTSLHINTSKHNEAIGSSQYSQICLRSTTIVIAIFKCIAMIWDFKIYNSEFAPDLCFNLTILLEIPNKFD